jgi:hypothetical protein
LPAMRTGFFTKSSSFPSPIPAKSSKRTSIRDLSFSGSRGSQNGDFGCAKHIM